MALPFLGSPARRRDQIVGIDIGGHSTKAVHLQKRGDQVTLLGYAVVEMVSREGDGQAPTTEQKIRKVTEALGGRCKNAVVALGCTETLLRPTELPLVPVQDMRTMLKFNSKTYLQQDLSDHIYDCFVLPPRLGTKAETPKAGQKVRVLVGGAKRGLVEQSVAAAKAAGLMVEGVVPELIGPVNAFELAQPDSYAKEAVALVDVGFHNSSVCVLLNGELVLSRVVALGGERLTTGLAESLGTSYAEAEGIKVGLAHEVDSAMAGLIAPLARELRASLDYFEHQHDRPVSQVFVSGASARSEYVLQALQAELTVPCSAWNPVAGCVIGVPSAQMGGLEAVTALLPVAVGSALAML